MTKILWHSGAPWAQTGYGQQTALFTKRLADAGYDLTISSVWGLDGNTLSWNGIRVLPRDQKWGNSTLPEYARTLKPDLVLTLMDVWVLEAERFRNLPLACWVPVDHDPAPPKVLKFLRETSARPIAMSRFGEAALRDGGLDPVYVPHGVDTNIFKPRDRDEIKKQYGLDSRFVVGVVANNAGGMPPSGGPPRKSFPQSFMAFAQFYKKHPDAVLWLHSELSGRPGVEYGLNLVHLLERFDIPPEAVKFTDQVLMETGIDSEAMSHLYNAFDVLLNPSAGEGFGVPIIEAQACGTPVIVSDWTAMPELCGAGWKVGGYAYYNPPHDSFCLLPFVSDIIGALEEAYAKANSMRNDARLFAVQYDADKVLTEYWLPAVETVMKPREVAPLKLNRSMRRAAKKAAA